MSVVGLGVSMINSNETMAIPMDSWHQLNFGVDRIK